MPSHKTLVTAEEYLAMERVAESRSEYRAGEIHAMSGGTESHNLITVNILASLHQQLRTKPCKVFVNDLRVKIAQSNLYTYPDVVVACGEIKFEDTRRDTLLNPTLIIEVLSQSTEAYDRGSKFESYRKLESLKQYVLVAQDKPHIEVFTRQSDGRWILSEFSELGDSIDLAPTGCKITLSDVYAKIELP